MNPAPLGPEMVEWLAEEMRDNLHELVLKTQRIARAEETYSVEREKKFEILGMGIINDLLLLEMVYMAPPIEQWWWEH